MPEPYSNSQLSTYENCPLHYKFSYLDRIESEEEGIEAFVGIRVHEVLQKLYKDLKLSKMNSLEDLLAYFDEIWAKNWHDDIVIVRDEYTPENYRDTGKRCITNYYKKHHPFDRDTTVSLEERLRIPLDEENEYVLVGYVDRISKTSDDKFEIHDYKTSSMLPPQEKIDRDRQLTLYQIGVQHKWPSAKDFRLIWHYVAMDVDMESARSEEDIQKIKDEAIELINEIESTSEFTPKESALCDWCEYQEMCPIKKHPAKVEKLPINEYLKEGGVQLVNKYMDAMVKKRELEIEIQRIEEEEIEQLKEALFAFAEREGAQIIQGSGYKLNLKTYENYRFPSKREDLYKELEGIIRDSPLWDKIAMLDTFALDRLLKEGEVEEELMEKIMKYARLEEARRIYVRRG